MHILILDGHPEPSLAPAMGWLERLAAALHERGSETDTVALRKSEINHCTGCWDCWVKTPGRCVFRDDMDEILTRILHSDLTLFAAPLVAGFVNALTKMTWDRMIPLVHPYFEFVEGENHHRARYERYPLFSLVLSPEPDTESEDVEITATLFRRFALNMKTTVPFIETTSCAPEEVADALGAL